MGGGSPAVPNKTIMKGGEAHLTIIGVTDNHDTTAVLLHVAGVGYPSTWRRLGKSYVSYSVDGVIPS